MFDFKRLMLMILFLSLPLAPMANGETDLYKSSREYRGDLFNTKVYDPHSKSYFEMKSGLMVGRYQDAHTYAKSQSYKGTAGRLAIIKSKETQLFINRIFRPSTETWIGLRLTCRPRSLVWNTGEVINRETDYTNWGLQWHYPDKFIPCSGGRGASGGNAYNGLFAGIALIPYRGVIRWWAVAPGHGMNRALIEYPAGKP